MCGWDNLCGISKFPLEIPHKICYPYIERCVFYWEVKMLVLLDLRTQRGRTVQLYLIKLRPGLLWNFHVKFMFVDKNFQTWILVSSTAIRSCNQKTSTGTFWCVLRPSDAIWWHRSGSTLAQVMACSLTAPSHYLNQYWLGISEVQWLSSKDHPTRDISAINH